MHFDRGKFVYLEIENDEKGASGLENVNPLLLEGSHNAIHELHAGDTYSGRANRLGVPVRHAT